MKKIALFDIDKTIYNGYVISPLAEYQLKKGVINQSCLNELYGDLKLYKAGKVDYESTIASLLDHWAVGLEGQNYQYVLEETILFFKGVGNKFYDFLIPVMQMLKPTYDVYFITGEAKFVGEAATSLFSSKGFISSELELKDTKFTGKVNKYLARRDEKLKAIQQLLKTYNKDDSFAFGDSEGDIQMLNSAKHAICINATEGLMQYAQEKDWHIVEPKDVINLVNSLIKEGK
ncbi:HAD family hydrolase [Patescibacteria group bacterium]